MSFLMKLLSLRDKLQNYQEKSVNRRQSITMEKPGVNSIVTKEVVSVYCSDPTDIKK